MKEHQLLTTLVAANVLLAFASVGSEAWFGWTFPPALADFTQARFSRLSHMDGTTAFQLLLISAAALCAFAAWIGLLRYRPYARRLLLIAMSLTLAHVLLAGPSVRTSVGAMFHVMDSVVGGALLGLVYFSDLARRFARPAS